MNRFIYDFLIIQEMLENNHISWKKKCQDSNNMKKNDENESCFIHFWK